MTERASKTKPAATAMPPRLKAAAVRHAAYLLELRDEAKRLRDSFTVESDFPDVSFAAELHHRTEGKSHGRRADPLCMPRAVACDWLQGLIERTEDEILSLGVDL